MKTSTISLIWIGIASMMVVIGSYLLVANLLGVFVSHSLPFDVFTTSKFEQAVNVLVAWGLPIGIVVTPLGFGLVIDEYYKYREARYVELHPRSCRKDR